MDLNLSTDTIKRTSSIICGIMKRYYSTGTKEISLNYSRWEHSNSVKFEGIITLVSVAAWVNTQAATQFMIYLEH